MIYLVYSLKYDIPNRCLKCMTCDISSFNSGVVRVNWNTKIIQYTDANSLVTESHKNLKQVTS